MSALNYNLFQQATGLRARVMEKMLKVSSDMLKTFSGEGNLIAWLAKIKPVAKLQKFHDIASFISFLEGDSLAVNRG